MLDLFSVFSGQNEDVINVLSLINDLVEKINSLKVINIDEIVSFSMRLETGLFESFRLLWKKDHNENSLSENILNTYHDY